ncbi:glycoside hydrolase family 78 protein [Nocardioides panacisoli]|uniref:family 78 glycoside hydrolase catalytic domain n=1 Tax=Nocardioides panacisoli TaxID=627624 RepID=UPI001C625FF3|nr:family 78 glycoside hydrolase catalytic domain [Nocardioides panacisoli]QYJ03013.1 glycoside hydrolase family 78 protein [Nocardioides panacisoli]
MHLAPRHRAAALVGTLALVAGLFSLAAPTSAAPGSPMPDGLTIGQRTAPADLDDTDAPLLGWRVGAEAQSAYQVQVAQTRPGLMSGKDLHWDSGRTVGAQSTNVPYAGPQLERGEHYLWRVRTWTEDGKRSPWSRVAEFGTALGGDWGNSEPIWLGSPAVLDWQDYTLETTFRITTQNATILFNAQDAENYLMWQFRGDGVNQLAPHQRVNGSYAVLKTVPLDVDLQRDTDYRLRLEVEGATVRTYLNDALVDTTEDVRFNSGTVGFRTGGSERNAWDDLRLTSADGRTLYDNDFEDPSTDFSCGTVEDGWLRVGTGQNCVHGLSGTDWAFLRGEFATAADKEIAWASVFATGSSPEPGRQYVYKLWLNGEFVGLGPVRSIAGETRYDGYDVTDLVREGGANALGALSWTRQDQRFQAQLVVEYADGSQQTFGTGEEWSSMAGGEVYPWAGSIGTNYFTAPKEDLQAAAYPVGFDEPGFDDTGWTAATPQSAYDDLVATPTDKVGQRLEYPAEVVEKEPGRYFIDYGRTWIGGVRLALDGEAGQEVELRFGEELWGPQEVRSNMRTGNQYQDHWTLTDEPLELETWGMRVFRYVEVLGAPTGLGAEDFPALAQVYPFDVDGAVFDSSDESLNQVWQLSKDTVETTNHNLYVDSWTREREPYEADSYLQMMANFFTSSDPTLGNYSIDYLLTRRTWPTEWPLYTILAMHDSYEQTGDVAQLARSYDQLVDKLPTQWIEEETGLIRKDFRSNGCNSQTDCDIVDWPSTERDGYVFGPYNTVINSLAYRTFMDMATIAEALGKDDDAASYAATGERLRAAINEYLWDDEVGAYRDGLRGDRTPVDHHAVHASSFASAFGVPDEERAAEAAEYLGSRGMQCSVYCAAFLVEALYNGDRSDLAHELLTGTGRRSWHNMIANGAGATTEAWDASLKGNMTYSHPWAASPAFNVPQGMFGIRPTTPGYATYDVRPQPGAIDWAHVTRPTLRGSIGAAFHTVGDRTDVGVHVPGNSVATVHVPVGDADRDVVYVDGRARDAVRERGYLRVEGVTQGCHVLSTQRGGAPKDDPRLTAACE